MNKEIKFYQGTNFWVALFMATLGTLLGFTDVQGKEIVQGVFFLTGTIFAVREKIKTTDIDWLSWIKSPNTRNYLFAAIAAAIPSLPGGLFTGLNDLATAAIGGNWPGVVSALLSVATIIYFWTKTPKPATT